MSFALDPVQGKHTHTHTNTHPNARAHKIYSAGDLMKRKDEKLSERSQEDNENIMKTDLFKREDKTSFFIKTKIPICLSVF